MGSDESYFCEWIELHNSGAESMSLENWALQIGDGPMKPLAEGELNSNAIAAGGYYVVERLVTSCPDPVPAVDDALVAFGSIPNSNITIRLFSDVEQEHPVDQIASGEDWIELGGDNETKETAQYTDSGWITAAATPGQVNAGTQSTRATATEESSSDADIATTTTTSSVRQSRGATKTTISLAEQAAKQEQLDLTISYPTTVYVAQPVQFTVEVAGRSQVVRNSLRYNWNFGDLTTTASSAPTHQYDFPGEYVVSVQASYYEYEASEQRTVTVLPVKLSMNITADGHLQIHNTSPYEVDVSQYTLSTVPPITFPDRSVITPRGTITVANAQLGTHAGAIQLHDTAGNLISDTESMADSEAPSVARGQRATPPPQVAGAVQTVTNEVRTTATNSTSTLPSAVTSTPVLAAQGVAPEPAAPERQWLWYGLLAAVVGVGVLTIFLTTAPTSPREDDELVD